MKYGSTRAVAGLLFMLAGGACSAENAPGSPPMAGGGSTQVSANGGGPMLIVGNDSAGTSSGGASLGGATTQEKTCDDSCSSVGKCDDGTCRATDNIGKLSPEQQTLLQKGGAGDAQFQWLYPYDKTVFPRGLISPTLQFDGAAADALYVHVSFPGFDYQGFFGSADPLRIKLSSAIWTTLTSTARGTDSVKVEVSKLRSGVVTGPVTQTWTIAAGSLRGTIYYDNYYDAELHTMLNEAIMRLKPGEAASEILVPDGTCTTVSADGSTLVAAFLNGFHSYDLRAGAQLITQTTDGTGDCGTLYSDGSLVMFFNTPTGAQIRDTKTGASVPALGWGTVSPTGGRFSPDGNKFAVAEKAALSVMDFAVATKTFSNRRELTQTRDGFGDLAFTADSRSVIYAAPAQSVSDLNRVSIDTQQVSALVLASKSESGHNNGYVTALPIAVGGYYWIVFASDRRYGNTLPADSLSSLLWVAAVDLSASATDSSHPAFYLDGQITAGNNRFASWALDPCKADGSSCGSGDQCCGGFCRESQGKLQCLSTPPTTSQCSAEFEKCVQANDCCDHTFDCIDERCAAPSPVK